MFRGKSRKLLKNIGVIIVFAIIMAGLPLATMAESENSESLADGKYVLPIRLWHITSDQASMANQALEQTSTLIIEEGKGTLHVIFKPLSMMGAAGYLSELNLLDNIVFNASNSPIEYDKVPATVLSTYDVVDEYNDPDSTDPNCAGKPYPEEMTIPVVPGQEYTYVHVYIPLMGGMGFGNQLARIKLLYDDIEEITDATELLDLLETALYINQGNYTAESWNALQTAINNAQIVADDENATQIQINEQVSVLGAAINNLEKIIEQIDVLADGTYSITGEMVKLNRHEISMANDAISHNIRLEVADKDITVFLDLKAISVMNSFGYLGQLYYFGTGFTYDQNGSPRGNLLPVTVHSTQKDSDGREIIDNYNDKDNLYPDLISFPLVASGEFIPLQVVIPLMESIAPGLGTHDVLLRLDWDTLQSTDNDDFEIEKPVEQSPAINHEEPTTGVKISADKGVFPEGTTSLIEAITNGSNYEKAKTALSDVSGKFILFDITFKDADGNIIQPNGLVKVSLPIPQDYDQENIAVYRINDDGTRTLMSGTVEDGYYVFYSNHFSLYALVEKTGDLSDDSLISDELIKTGENLSGGVILGFVLLMISVAAMIFMKKKKQLFLPE